MRFSCCWWLPSSFSLERSTSLPGPGPAPTGPSRSVRVWATVTRASATASLSDASGITTLKLTDGGMAKDEEAWARDIAFGGSVEVTVLVTEVFSDDDTGESGSATCRILINDQVVAKSVVDVANGLGSCTWTNDGR